MVVVPIKKTSLRTKLVRKTLRAAMPAVQVLCQPPRIESIKRALFIQPHPDDNQIGAGGTIARLVASGAEVYELTVLDDRFLDLTPRVNDLTVRQREAEAAEKALGMKSAGFLGFGDRTEASVRDISKAIVGVIREVKPDAIFTVDPLLATECHEDHIKVGTAVKNAFLDASFSFYPEYENGHARTDVWQARLLCFYYTDRPNELVDIGDYEDLKFESIRCHVSQREKAIEAGLKIQAQYFAQGTPFKAAEAFRVQGSFQSHCFNLPVE